MTNKQIGPISDKIFMPETAAARMLVPLLDSLNWQGDNSKLYEALVDKANTMNIDGLLETLANLKFKYYKIKNIRINQIDSRILPVLLVKGGMYYLIIKKEGKHSLIYDGASGTYRQIPNKRIKGTIYTFKYAADLSDSLIVPQDNWFSKLIYRFRKPLIQLTMLTMGITLLDLLLPLFVILLFDKILNLNSVEALIMTFAGVIIYLISSFTLSNYRSLILNYMSTRMGNIISLQTFTRLMYLSPSYTETASINSQISRIKDFDSIKEFVISGSFISLFNLVFASLYVIAMFIIGGWIGVIPLITLIVLIVVGFIMRPFHKIKMEKQSETSSQRQQLLIEILKNLKDIKVSGTKNNWIERLKNFAGASINDSYELYNYNNMSNNISYLITNLSVLVIIYAGVLQVFAGRMTTGSLIGVLILSWKIMTPIRSAFSLLVQINGLKKSISQINRFMKLPQDNSLKTNMVISKEIEGFVKFSDVSIKYNMESQPALLGINFETAPGKILGISGHDGAGKSTILKLILGMYQPQAGRIIIDGVNVRQLEPLSLRRSISYAPEKDMIFSGTIRENFQSFNPGISDRQILDLSEITGLSEYLVLFKDGLDTKLNDNLLSDLSPCFRKLFNITRMLCRDSNIYLMDEPENHLDSKCIDNILKVVKDLSQNASVIISTKDTRFMSICDKVMLLDRGRIKMQSEPEKVIKSIQGGEKDEQK